MKVKQIALAAIVLSLMFMAPTFLVGLTVSDFTHCEPTEYNPWADGDDDGDIDIFDVVYVATKYGENGCATKTLNITNWPAYFYPPYPGEMNITNWPLDVNGNLKVSITDGLIGSSGTTAIEITALDWTSRSVNAFDYGIRINGAGNLTLPFVFNPIGEDYNITDVWVKTVFSFKTAPTSCTYLITFNNIGYFSSGTIYGYPGVSEQVYEKATQAPNAPVINRGINILDIHYPAFSGGGEYMMFHKVDIYIEYEYSA